MEKNKAREVLARCGFCDMINYESVIQNHIKRDHAQPNTTIIWTDSASQDADELSDNGSENFQYTEVMEDTPLVNEFAQSDIAFRWGEDEIKLLTSLYSQHKADFENKKTTNRSVWKSIANTMSQEGVGVTWEQCENKFKNLKKQYKKIIDNNSKTGRGTIDWAYFDIMDGLFCKHPEVSPLSLCSNADGFVLRKSSTPDSHLASLEHVPAPHSEPPSPCGSGSTTSVGENVPKKRKRSVTDDQEPVWFKKFAEDAQRRHNERIEQQNKLISVLQQFVEKL